MKNKTQERFHYKNGENVTHAEHLRTTAWHRGVREIKKSRKDFTCVFGCKIPKGSSYVTLEIMAGNGRADCMVDFALCNSHQSKTEAISGPLITTEITPFEILSIWEGLIKDADRTNKIVDIEGKTIARSDTLPEEVVEPTKYIEGATKTIHVNIYERSQKARKDCIKVHGYACVVCSFDFEMMYGEIGRNFIHVHHLKQLADIHEEYELNPIDDLRPVCPNCHSMLHKRKPAYSIEELREIMNAAKRQLKVKHESR